jgi:hypothetical protein
MSRKCSSRTPERMAERLTGVGARNLKSLAGYGAEHVGAGPPLAIL